VLDSFIGSGTTAIACRNLNRRFIGFEIDETYYNIAIKRLQTETRQLRLNHQHEKPNDYSDSKI